MPADYESTARALALDPNDSRTSDGPLPSWRNFTDRPSLDNGDYRARFASTTSKLQNSTLNTMRSASSHYRRLSMLQRILLALLGLFGVGVLILFFKFGESLFAWIAPLADGWREVKFGWLILWAATFVVSFPPLIGYSSCVTLAGFVYGLWEGWAIVATATILGSTTSFLLSRHLLTGFVHRLISQDRRFAALALTLKHDGLKLLIMIRLCPLPYSLANGAIATVPTVHWANFALATAIATPRLLIGVFIGSRLARIAQGVGEMDSWARFVNWCGILASMAFGVFTAWWIYRQTKRRADELEAVEANGVNGRYANGSVNRYNQDEVDLDLDEETEVAEEYANKPDAPANGGKGYRDEPVR